MDIALLQSDASLDGLHDELFFTLVLLRAEPRTALQVPAWEAALAQHRAATDRSQALREAALQAQARLVQADHVLDGLVDKLDVTLRALSPLQRHSPLYARYFGEQPPNRVKRPMLGQQVETMTGWVPSLKAAAEVPLQALGAALEKALLAAADCQTALTTARAAQADLRQTGARHQFVQDLNVLRQQTAGQLVELATAAKLASPRDWAESFFRHTQRVRPTLESQLATLQEAVRDAETQQAALKAQIVQVQADLAAQAQTDQARRTADQTLAAAKEALAKQAAEVAALEKSLPKKRRGK